MDISAAPIASVANRFLNIVFFSLSLGCQFDNLCIERTNGQPN
jgi:hypothetical protein